MSILNPTKDPAVTAANQVQFLIRNPFTIMQLSGKQGYNLIWNNPNATPFQVIAALGTSCKQVFEFAQLNISTLAAAATIDGTTPPSLPEIPAHFDLTFNDDGSGNLTILPSSSSSSSSSSTDDSSSSSN